MNKYSSEHGQALLETAVALVVLLTVTLGGIEFSRAWYVKNSLKNAVRQGARVSAVTPKDDFKNSNTTFKCTQSVINSCPNSDPIINAVCCQPGIPKVSNQKAPAITVTCEDDTGSPAGCGSLSGGGTVKVTANYTDSDFFMIGNAPWPWGKGVTIIVDASMRYE